MSSVNMNSVSSTAKKTNLETVKQVEDLKDKNDEPVNRQVQSTKPTCKKFKASKHQHLPRESTRKMKYEPMPKSLPVKILKIYGRKHAANYSENEKKRRQAKKLEYANKVGWMERTGRHRHQHQARREKEFINFMHDLPLDYDMSESD